MESYIDIEESIFLSRVEDRGFHVGGGGYHVEGKNRDLGTKVRRVII